MIIKCSTCNKEFNASPWDIKNHRGKYCSRKCWHDAKGYSKKLICKICGKEFYKYPKDIERGNPKYCSKKCYGISKRTRIKKKCLICGKIFMARPHSIKIGWGKFCSRKCSSTHRRNKITLKCKLCGKLFKTVPYFIKIGSAKFCSHKCHSNFAVGENSQNWLGGKSFEPYGIEFNKYLRNKIRERDNYKCKICGVPQIECNRKLAIHHIDYNKKNNNINNLISLCEVCHGKTNTNRENWTSNFKAGVI